MPRRLRSKVQAFLLIAMLLCCIAWTTVRSAEAQSGLQDLTEQIRQVAAAEEALVDSVNPDQIFLESQQHAAISLDLLGTLEFFDHRLDRACDAFEDSLGLANNFSIEGKLAEALPECVQLSRRRPDAIRDWKLEALADWHNGDVAHAATAVTRDWQLHGEGTTGLLAVTLNASAGRSQLAEQIAAEMVKKDSVDVAQEPAPKARLYTALASALESGGDVNGMIEQIRNVIHLEPDSSVAHFALGNAFWQLNEHQYNPDTLREFREAQRLAPQDFLTNFDLGLIWSQYHRFDEASRALTNAAQLDPRSPDPWLQLGINAFGENKPEVARDALERAIMLTGTDEQHNGYAIQRAYALLSRLDADAGQQLEAENMARRAQAMHEELSQEALRKGSASTQSPSATAPPHSEPVEPLPKNAATSVSSQDLELANKLDSLIAECLNDSGTVLAREHDYAAALQFFRKAAKADATLVPVMRNIGLAEFHVGDYEDAISALTQALQQTPGDTLAERYLEQARTHPTTYRNTR